MNFLDLLPDDVMKIINRKVHDLQIKQRKIERKRNKEIAEDNKLKADRRRMIFYKYAGLYHKYVFISEEKERTHLIRTEKCSSILLIVSMSLMLDRI